ncbi:uncharacterized protein LOC117299940 isoform X1 [Asterias rubens]|uniref:uncharacterized protein LOC117299940 isoform X1 n=1 Tax=Asterias rubens TaxID=7604 RepID=UPI0014557E57|nr:uncharacterized protein LOC117299940 isoform X1 [Asterias rubens]XP_033639445.1 uncharacterized protein LOC117299940 isoform X1 [Asterias rubens]
MFKISEEDFALGDEDFWSGALSDEAPGAELLSSNCLNVQGGSDNKTTRSLASDNRVQEGKSRIAIVQKGSNLNFADASSKAMTPKDLNIGLHVSACVTSANLPQRKFSFKPKSPKGCFQSISIKTVEQGIISTGKSVRPNDSICTSTVNNSNLAVGFGSKELRIVQDKRKKIPAEASLLRPISYHAGVTPNFSQSAVTLNAEEETHKNIKSTNHPNSKCTVGVDDKTMTPKEPQLRNTMEWFQTPTTTQPSQALTKQGKLLDSKVKTNLQMVSTERVDNFDDQFNSWEDDFDWDSVILQPSTTVTKSVSREESKSRSANPATPQPCTVNIVKLDCNTSQPYAVTMDTSPGKSSGKITQQRPIINLETLSDQERCNQLQNNPPRTNVLPCTPSNLCPIQRSSTPIQRMSTPLGSGTSGCRPPVSSFNNKFTSQGVPSTPNIINSSTRQFTPAQRSHYTGNQSDRAFTTHGAKPQSPVMTTPQTSLLTSRVAQLFQTPTSVKTATSHTRVRKFPGPAGVLPQLMEGQKLNDLSELVSPETTQDVPKSGSTKSKFIPSEDDGEADFSHGAWKRMKVDLDLEDDNQHSILAKNNIALLLRKASLKQLTKNKVPHLCVMIKSITINTDASVVLRDPTGEIQGTIHRRLIEEHQAELKPGCVLVLRQVGVLSPSLRNHYLNITPSNLIQVYPSESTHYLSTQQTTPNSSKTTCKKFSYPVQSNLESSETFEGVDRIDSCQVKKGTLMASTNKDTSNSEYVDPCKYKNQNDIVLNEKDQPSNHEGNLQEDFTQLLADIASTLNGTPDASHH